MMYDIKNIIDISLKIEPNIVTWDDNNKPAFKQIETINENGVCNVSSFELNSHTGTHVDAPLHFIDNDIPIETVPMEHFIGMAKVFEIITDECISVSDLINLDIKQGDIILFKTKNSTYINSGVFNKDFVYINKDASDYLVYKKIKSVGIDYISVGSYHNTELNKYVHQTLLGNNIGVIEGLSLQHVEPGSYFISCLPLNISKLEASPVRAVLIEFK